MKGNTEIAEILKDRYGIDDQNIEMIESEVTQNEKCIDKYSA